MSLFVASRLYELPSEEAKVIQDYLSRVRRYINAHNLGDELIDDLESNLAEKLDAILAQKSHGLKDILTAIQSLGEPEEVFAFEETSSRSHESKWDGMKSIKSFMSRPWKRSQTDKIFFGVCGGLAQELWVDAIWLRILFILLAFASGFGILLYIILIFLMEKNMKQLGSEIQTISDKITPELQEVGRKMSNQSGTLMELFERIVELAIRVFSGLFGLWALGITVAISIFIGMAHTNLIIGNMDIGGAFPDSLYPALFFAFACIFVLMICFFARMVGKRVWSLLSLGLILGLLMISVSLWARTVTAGLSKYNTESVITKTATLTGIKDGVYELQYKHRNQFYSPDRHINIVTGSGAASGTITIRSDISGWGSSADTVKATLAHFIPAEGRIDGNMLILGRNTNNLFDQVSPFVFPSESITIIVPPGIVVHEEWYAREQEYNRRMLQERRSDRIKNKNMSRISEDIENKDSDTDVDPTPEEDISTGSIATPPTISVTPPTPKSMTGSNR